MSEGKLIIYALVFVFLVGAILSWTFSELYIPNSIVNENVSDDVTSATSTCYELSVIPFFDFDNFCLNPMYYIGDSSNSTINDSVSYLDYIPTWLIFPIITILIVMVLYAIIKLLPTT